MLGLALAFSGLSCLQTGLSFVVGSNVLKPSVQLDRGTFLGKSSGLVTEFLGMPFAEPPIGNLRLRLPRANREYTGFHNATAFGPSCIQQPQTAPTPSVLSPTALQFLQASGFTGDAAPVDDNEDCLTVNVVTPSNATSRSKLPVLLWLYGGGFQAGGSSSFNGSIIVQRSLELEEPVIYVSLNYRFQSFRYTALGFPASEQVLREGIGNLGLQDQRQALRWIQKYIHAFGGDPNKVTIWGQSAGAISVALQMVTNGGHTEGLFRAAFMHSGSPIPIGPLSEGQPFFDAIAANVSCAGTRDTLQCLREVPIEKLRVAMNASPNIFAVQSLNLAWVPRVDGVFLKDDPQKLVLKGSVADIPFVTGDCDDEGTLFTLATTNLTTDQEVHDYLTTTYFRGASNADMANLLQLYPNDTTQGSPFDTGTLNAITPQFKRLAAIQGDLFFQAPRRLFLEQRSPKQPTFSFLSKRMKGLSDFGAVHGSDLQNVYGPGDMTDYLIRFAANLDPNGETGIFWPRYSTRAPQLLTFLDGRTLLNITLDTYRTDGIQLLMQLTLSHPL